MISACLEKSKSAREVLFVVRSSSSSTTAIVGFRHPIHLGILAGRTRLYDNELQLSSLMQPCPKHNGRPEKASLITLYQTPNLGAQQTTWTARRWTPIGDSRRNLQIRLSSCISPGGHAARHAGEGLGCQHPNRIKSWSVCLF